MTTPQTTQELLDWFAERERGKSPLCYGSHPLPATLDTAAMLFAKYLPGYNWRKGTGPTGKPEWSTWHKDHDATIPTVRVPVTGITREAELHDRLAMVYAALNAKEKA